ncbi:hypothetical protein EPVG_00284 [Emiliania huxleyi virus 201]|nr:hypothetical protein ELVG_00266 [Emiliania huxleyi virus 203]AEP15689.1 hypothetical protein EQVG_00279 [Emiliania huxleyi virus 207]AEP16279.1 hypothetical protein ERVG_00406 [Emiliania huxleyi virus 208]AET98171.1 hypothetical protein EPVG_00284 [Emiliania huxleyi virus 201]
MSTEQITDQWIINTPAMEVVRTATEYGMSGPDIIALENMLAATGNLVDEYRQAQATSSSVVALAKSQKRMLVQAGNVAKSVRTARRATNGNERRRKEADADATAVVRYAQGGDRRVEPRIKRSKEKKREVSKMLTGEIDRLTAINSRMHDANYIIPTVDAPGAPGPSSVNETPAQAELRRIDDRIAVVKRQIYDNVKSKRSRADAGLDPSYQVGDDANPFTMNLVHRRRQRMGLLPAPDGSYFVEFPHLLTMEKPSMDVYLKDYPPGSIKDDVSYAMSISPLQYYLETGVVLPAPMPERSARLQAKIDRAIARRDAGIGGTTVRRSTPSSFGPVYESTPKHNREFYPDQTNINQFHVSKPEQDIEQELDAKLRGVGQTLYNKQDMLSRVQAFDTL